MKRLDLLTSGTSFGADTLRFLVAGAANTALTILLYQALLFFYSAQLSYLLAWFAGLLFVMIVYPNKVFAGGRKDVWSRLRFGLAYAAVFLLGLGMISVLDRAGMSARLSILIVLPVTTAVNLWVGRALLRGKFPIV